MYITKIISLLLAISMLVGGGLMSFYNRISSSTFAVVEFIGWGFFMYGLIDLVLPSTTVKIENNEKKVTKIQYTLGDYKRMMFLSAMSGIVIFGYTMARQIKDLLVSTALDSTSRSLLKICVLVFLSMTQIGYSWISHIVSLSNIVYVVSSIFTAFYCGFYWFCLNKNISKDGNANLLNTAWRISDVAMKSIGKWLPTGMFNTIYAPLQEWPISIFYFVCELFGVVMLSTLFWQINNRMVRKSVNKGHKRFILMFGQLAMLASGYISEYIVSSANISMSTGLFIFTAAMSIAMTLLCVVNFIFFKVNKPEEYQEEHVSSKTNAPKKYTSIFSFISNHPYYLFAILLTVYHGISTVFMETYWKDYYIRSTANEIVSQANNIPVDQFTSRNSSLSPSIKESLKQQAACNMTKYTYVYSKSVSRFALLFSVCGPSLLNMLNIRWTGFALSTPILMCVSVMVMFMPRIIYGGSLVANAALANIIIYLGMACLVVSKSCKFILFDNARETYNLQQKREHQRNIKNVEGLFARLGKGLGSAVILILSQLSFGLNSTVLSVLLFIICSIMIGIWIYSILYKIAPQMNNIDI